MKVDLVRGLPRSEENHSSNGMTLSADGTKLYLAQGGNTNNGAPSSYFSNLSEYAIGGTVLEVDLVALDAMADRQFTYAPGITSTYRYDLPTLNDPTVADDGAAGGEDAGGMDLSGPFGGHDGLNQAVLPADAPLRIYATGLRNAYDIVLTQAGQMFTIDNGGNEGLGDAPLFDGDGNPTNLVNNGGNGYFDTLHLLSDGGYYGHPNPIRAYQTGTVYSYDDAATPGVIAAIADASAAVPGAVQIAPGYLIDPSKFTADAQRLALDGLFGAGPAPLASFGASTNGLTEYTADAFNGEITGDLVATSFDGTIKLINLAPDGVTVLGVTNLATPGGVPLDITQGPDGSLWVAQIGAGQVLALTPSAGPVGADPDIDGDGLANLDDPFQADPGNGTTTVLAPNAALTWNFQFGAGNVSPGPTGLFLGLTGHMTNGERDFVAPFEEGGLDLNNVKIGTAAGGGLVVVEAVSNGTATGSGNTGEYQFQTGLSVAPNVAAFNVRWTAVNPFPGLAGLHDGQQIGGYIGTGDQDNFLRVSAGPEGGAAVHFALESGGVVVASQDLVAAGLLSAPAGSNLMFDLAVDRTAGTATPSVTYAGAGGPVTVTGAAMNLAGMAILDAIDGHNAVAGHLAGLALGLWSTNAGEGSQTTFQAAFDEIKVTSAGPVETLVQAVNVGGEQVTASTGVVYQADPGPATGTTFVFGTDNDITGTVDDEIYNSERWTPGGSYTYEVPVANGSYRVELHFAEIYDGILLPGQRVFDMQLEGQAPAALQDIDIFGQVGPNAPLVMSQMVTVSDGSLSIQVGPGSDAPGNQQNAKLSAFAVYRSDAGPAVPTLSVVATDASRAEGQAGTTNFTFTVERTGSASGVSSASWAVLGAAVDAGDFAGGVLPSGVVSFADGETSRTITVQVAGDTAVEADEGFTVTLSNPSAGTLISTASAVGTIINDDADNTASARLAITPGTDLNATTYAEPSFELTNTGAAAITSLTIDLHGSLIAGNVFDPFGTFGDDTALDFTQYGASQVAASWAYGPVVVTEGGYTTLTVELGGGGLAFGQTLSFRVDVDPASIEGPAPGPNEAGSISGFEQTGALVTVGYADGSSQSAKVFADGTAGGGQARLVADLLPAVTLGLSLADGTPLALTAANGILQATLPGLSGMAGAAGNDVIVTVTGTTGQTVRLAVAELGGLGQDIPLGSHEGNTVLQPQLFVDATIGAGGTVDVPIALPAITPLAALEEGSVSGRFAFTAALVDPATGDATSLVGQTVVVVDEPPATPATLVIAAASAVQTEGNSGSTAFTFTVTRTGSTAGASSAAWAVTGSGANAADGADFAGGVLPSGVVSFAAGETSKTVTVQVAGDTLVEANEGFTVTLSGPSAGTAIGTAAAVGSILNDDVAPGSTLAIAAASAVLSEGNSGSTAFTFTVTRTGSTAGASSAAWAVTGSGGSAANAADFAGGVLPSGVVSFAAGETSKTVTVQVAGDTLVEANEGFTVTLSAPSAGTVIGTAAAVGSILNDDVAPGSTLAIAAASAVLSEGNSGSTAFTFTVTRTGSMSGASSANWAVTGSGASAANGADFAGGVLPSGVVSFAAGETSKTVTVQVAGDSTVEADEGFTVTLSGPSAGTTIGTAAAVGSILNDDVASGGTLVKAINVGGAAFTASTGVVYQADPGPVNAASTFLHAGDDEITGTVDDVMYNTERWTPGGSYTYEVPVANGSYRVDLHFAEIYDGIIQAGQRVFDMSLEGQALASLQDIDLFGRVGPDAALVLSEVVSVTDGSLSITVGPGSNSPGNAENAKLNAFAVFTADGAPPSATLAIAAASAVQAEGNSGSTAFTFTVTRTGSTAGASSAAWAVTGGGGSAANAADFAGGVLPSGLVSFATGETSKTITVQVAGDSTVEADEGFTVTLSGPSAGTVIGTAAAVGSILNDDVAPGSTLAIAAGSAVLSEGNSGSTAFTFTVTRTGSTSGASSANWAVTGSGANAANAADFAGGVLPSGLVSFAVGETSKTVTVQVAGDTLVEANEGFTVTLSGPSAGTVIGTAAAVGSILNDDVAPGSTLAIAAASAVLSEGNSGSTAFTFTVTRTGSTSGASSANWAVTGSGASAANGADFTGGALPSGVVSFAAGETSKTVTVQVAGDTLVEANEGFTVTLSGPSAGTAIGTAAAVGSILNDDVAPGSTLAIAAASAVLSEGNSGSTAFTFTVTRTGSTAGASSAAWAVTGSGGSAANAADFAGGVLPSGLVSFAAGETSKTITVQVAGDSTVEADEGFTVTLSGPSAGTVIGTAAAVGSILNDDVATGGTLVKAINVGGAAFTASTGVVYQADPGPVNAASTFLHAGDDEITGTVDDVMYNTERWTPGGSYTYEVPVANGSYRVDLHFAEIYDGIIQAGQRVFDMSLEGQALASLQDIDLFGRVGPDAALVLSEVVSVTDGSLSITVGPGSNSPGNAENAKLNAFAVFTADGAPPSATLAIAAASAVQAEGNSGSTAFTFTVTRTGSTSGASSAAWAVTGSGGSAANAADFAGGVLPSGVVSFAAGETSKTITVQVAGDSTVEADEGFTVTLSGPSAGTVIGTAAAVGSILNDDSAAGGVLSFASSTNAVSASLTAATWSRALKVMPFGDSITNGDAPDGEDEHGYRGMLWVDLIGNGKLVDMVGPFSNGNVPDPNHAGYVGESANDLLGYAPGLLATYSPDAILLMGGTNDVLQEANAALTVGGEIKGILDLVAQQNSATHVYVATVLPLASDTTGEVDAVNVTIRDAVNTAIASGQNVSLVEMPSVTVSDLFDGIHPTEQGYQEVAGYWSAAMAASPPNPLPATAIGPDVVSLIGSAQNDLLVGDGRANTLSGGSGVDWLRGEGGDDTLDGGDGNDVLIGGAGNDLLITGSGSDQLYFITPDTGGDVVQDFADGLDLLVFGMAATGVDAFSDLVVSLVGGQVNVAWSPVTGVGVVGTGSVTLANLSDPALFSAADIRFLP